jgi:mono/diheme cytochrome c family protein
MKKAAIILGAIILLVVIPLAVLDKGDWFGPLERAARQLLNGWDMWDQPSIRPYETPMPLVVKGTLPLIRKGTGFVSGALTYERGLQDAQMLEPKAQIARGKLIYQRFCNHCHGPNGDGRIIVGESFDVKLPDLRASTVQEKSNEILFKQLFNGTANMIPLADTLTPGDMILSIMYVRTLKNAPSRPFFTPKFTQPIMSLIP